MLFRTAVSSVALLVVACSDPDGSQAKEEGRARGPKQPKLIYRCDMSPLIDFEAEDPLEELATANSRVTADGLCDDSDLYDELANLVAGLPKFTEQDLPFVGYCEHYLLSDGGPQALLIGFVCEGHGIVVWEVHPDEQGRWLKSDVNTLRGTEADKGAIQAILSRQRFTPL